MNALQKASYLILSTCMTFVLPAFRVAGKEEVSSDQNLPAQKEEKSVRKSTPKTKSIIKAASATLGGMLVVGVAFIFFDRQRDIGREEQKKKKSIPKPFVKVKNPSITKNVTWQDIDAVFIENQQLFTLTPGIKNPIEPEKIYELDDKETKEWKNDMKRSWERLTQKIKKCQEGIRLIEKSSELSQKEKEKKVNRIKRTIRIGKEKMEKNIKFCTKYSYNLKSKKWEEVPKEKKKENVFEAFAEEFIKLLKHNYINWEAFKEQIAKVGKELNTHIQNSNYKDIYFMVPSTMRKSNTWMFFIFWGYIRDTLKEKKEDINYHFIGHEHDIDSGAGLSYFFKNSSLIKNIQKKETTALFYFDDMAYSGFQVHNQLEYFLEDLCNLPPHLYVVMPYVSQQAKRLITSMDTKNSLPNISSCKDLVEYLNGEAKPSNPCLSEEMKNKSEEEFFKVSPVKFLSSTKVIGPIPSNKAVGSGVVVNSTNSPLRYLTTPTFLPSTFADSVSVLGGIILERGYPGMEIEDKLIPQSFLKDHNYSPSQKKKIRDQTFVNETSSNESNQEEKYDLWIESVRILKYRKTGFMPIEPIYKTFEYKRNKRILDMNRNIFYQIAEMRKP